MDPQGQEVIESAGLPAPAQGETTVPAADATSVSESSEGGEPAPSKAFTQEEVDAIISKRLARERRAWERQQANPAPPPAPVNQEIKLSDFSTPEEYAEALADQKAARILAEREHRQQEATVAEAYAEREEKAMEKYEDYQQVAYNPQLPITEQMALAIRASDIGPDILYDLGLNPKEAARIAKLPAFLQIKEIGRLEGKMLAAPPAPKKLTSAPPPIRPLNAAVARPAGNPSFDTTDPRSVQTMTTSQWIEAERQRQIRKVQAQRTH